LWVRTADEGIQARGFVQLSTTFSSWRPALAACPANEAGLDWARSFQGKASFRSSYGQVPARSGTPGGSSWTICSARSLLSFIQGGDDWHALLWLGSAEREPRQQQDPDFPGHVSQHPAGNRGNEQTADEDAKAIGRS
jgi:hypothetical protein